MPCMWNDWLPEPIASQIRTEEPKRFVALIDALEHKWRTDKATLHIQHAVTGTLPYVPLVRAMIYSKCEPDITAIQRLVTTLLDIVLSTEQDLSAQARWGLLLGRLLRSHHRKLKSLTIPWRPFYTMLRRLHFQPSVVYEGAGVVEARRSALVSIIHKARRFFPPGSAAEIWAEFRPKLQDTTGVDVYEALGWLSMLMPTNAAIRKDGDWAVWVPDWMRLWGCVSHNQYWQSLWFGLFSRLIKHDIHGMVDWHLYLSEIWTRFLWAFQLPVGTASAQPPFGHAAPGLCQTLFAGEMSSRSAAVAHSAIYLIGRRPLANADKDEDDPALVALESAVALIEQYCHPSNGGKWTGSLSMFMREASAHLCRRLVGEHHAALHGAHAAGTLFVGEEGGDRSDSEEDSDDDSDSESGDEGAAAAEDDTMTSDDDGEDFVLGGNDDSTSNYAARRPLQPTTYRRIVSALLKLATKGQSSKDKHMKRYASVVLSQLAYIAPDIVLPSVHRHFVTALETVTAARQYGNAIQTLSLCVRPLLLAGLHQGSVGGMDVEVGVDGAAARALAAQSIASALMATLPGIDANDPPKTLAVFRLYCCVLSSVGMLPGGDSSISLEEGMPLYTEEWVEELLSRVFAVISNVDAPDTGGNQEHGGRDDGTSSEQSSFLLDGSSMFRPLMELLYVRLPPSLRVAAIKRTASFLIGSTFSTVSNEADILCNSISWSDPSTATEALLVPIITKLEADVATSARNNASNESSAQQRLSRVAETAIKWRLSLLASTTFHLGEAVVPYGERILRIIREMASNVPSQMVTDAAAKALATITAGLCCYYPLGQYRACPVRLDIDGSTNQEMQGVVAVQAYVDKYGTASSRGATSDTDTTSQIVSSSSVKTPWHVPNEAEIALTNQFLEEFLVKPSRQLIQLSSDDGSVPISGDAPDATNKALPSGALGNKKEMVRSLLMQLEGSLTGVRSCLPDFPTHHISSLSIDNNNNTPVSVIGQLGSVVGNAEMRALAAQATTAACKIVASSDSDTLSLLIRVIDHVLAVGSLEYSNAEVAAGAWATDEKWMHEPEVAGMLIDTVDGSSGGVRWRRRRPLWVATEKVMLNLEWRASQAAYRWYAGSTIPAAPLVALHPRYLELLEKAVDFVVHGYRGVRETAATVVERALKRYPALMPYVAAPVFGALAKAEDILDVKFPRVGGVGDGVPAVSLIPRLKQAALSASTLAAQATATGIPESDAEQGMAIGAAALLRGLSVWRWVSRDWKALRALCLALWAGAAHTGVDAQASLSLGMLVLAFRFIKPPPVDGTEEKDGVSPADALCLDALELASSDESNTTSKSPPLPWKFLAAANAYPLLLLPHISPPTASKLTNHYLEQLQSDVLTIRQIALVGIDVLMAPCWPAREGTLTTDSAAGASQYGLSEEVINAIQHTILQSLTTPNTPLHAPTFLPLLFQQLSNSHPSLAGDGSQNRSVYSLFRQGDDTVSKTLMATMLSKTGEWPAGRTDVAAVYSGSFKPTHARLIHMMCRVAPDVVIPALRSSVEDALNKPQDEDKPSLAAAAEVLSGIIASGACFGPALQGNVNDAQDASKSSEWDVWVKQAWTGALSAAPLDLLDLWSAALRYAVHELALAGYSDRPEVEQWMFATLEIDSESGTGGGATAAAMEEDMEIINHPSSESNAPVGTATTTAHNSISLYKSVVYRNDLLAELSVMYGGAGLANNSSSSTPPRMLVRILSNSMYVLPALVHMHAGEMVRHSVAGLAVDVIMNLLEPLESAPDAMKDTGNSPNGSNGESNGEGTMMAATDEEMDAVVLTSSALPSLGKLQRRARLFLEDLCDEFDSAVDVLYQHALMSGKNKTGKRGSGGGVNGEQSTLPVEDEGAVVVAKASDTEVLAAADAAIETELEMVRSQSQILDENQGIFDSIDANIHKQSSASQEASEYKSAVSTVAFTVEFACELLRSNTSAVTPWMLRLLPSLLRLQDLLPSEMQFMQLVARKALLTCKYQPLNGEDAKKMLGILKKTMAQADLWPERGAALAFSQYFWFRCSMNLGESGTKEVLDEVLNRLEDEKLEVRELAAATLSGLIKGLSEPAAAALRQQFLTNAETIFPAGRRRRRRGESAPEGLQASLPKRHAAALALESLVLSTPYDVPSWLPDVLMALVKLASEPAPVKTAVSKALGEFRRTHEEGGLAEMKQVMTAEQWEAIRDVASPASYFV